MQTIRRNGRWVIATACMLALTGGILVMNHGVGGEKADTRRTIKVDPREFSNVFRQVAHEVLPSIVAIEVKGKVAKISQRESDQFGDLFGENSPFGEMFKNDPRFKQF